VLQLREQVLEAKLELVRRGLVLYTFCSASGISRERPFLHRRHSGKMRGHVGEGRFTDDPLNTFGGVGVVEIPRLQKLLHFICERV
jgi:hypothetical protein